MTAGKPHPGNATQTIKKTQIKTAVRDCVYKTPVHVMCLLLLFMFVISSHSPHKDPTRRTRGDVKMRPVIIAEKGGGKHVTDGGRGV